MLVIAGGLASNQCRLAAAAGAKVGLEVLVLYAGDVDAPLRGNALLTKQMGAQIRRLGPVDEDTRGHLAKQAVADLQKTGRRPYLVGDPMIGTLGYIIAAQELADQARALHLDLRHVVLPGSMGVTEAGMIFGAACLGLPWTFHLISVEYDARTLRARLAFIFAGLSELLGQRLDANVFDRIRIDVAQLGTGYGDPTAASWEAAALFARYEALILEQTYVAKTFAGLLDMLTQGAIPSAEAVCIVHTGGTAAFFEQN